MPQTKTKLTSSSSAEYSWPERLTGWMRTAWAIRGFFCELESESDVALRSTWAAFALFGPVAFRVRPVLSPLI